MQSRRLALACLAIVSLVVGCTGAGGSAAPSPASIEPTALGPTASPSPAPSLPSPSASPAVSAAASAGVFPEKPQDPTFDLIKETPSDSGTTKQEYRITWAAPDGEATWFFVYGVVECLRASKANHGTPCVTVGMKIDVSKLVKLSTVSGDKRTTTVSWDVGEIGLPPYSAILIRAANDFGDSKFTIVHSEDVCWECTY